MHRTAIRDLWQVAGLRCLPHGSQCNNVHVVSLNAFEDIRTGRLGDEFLRRAPPFRGFFTPKGIRLEFAYPFWGIAQGRPFYHADWKMPPNPTEIRRS